MSWWKAGKNTRPLVLEICHDGRFYRDDKQTQRIRSTEGGYIDLIPFGGIEAAGNVVRWPPDESFAMSVAGFREACESAETVLVNELPVLVVSPPGFLLLKLVAWDDRHNQQPGKDASDIAYVLRHSETVLGIETLFDKHAKAMEAAGYDLECEPDPCFKANTASEAEHDTGHLVYAFSFQSLAETSARQALPVPSG